MSVPLTVEVKNPGSNLWHNTAKPWDVTGDNRIAPDDALTIINDINANEARLLPHRDAAMPPYFDVDDDDFISPGDALAVINKINAGGDGEEEMFPSQTPDEIDQIADVEAADYLFGQLTADLVPSAGSRRG